MPYEPSEIVERYAAGATTYTKGEPLAPDAGAAWEAVRRAGTTRLGSARVRDSARREWLVEPRQDGTRAILAAGRKGDAGREDEELRTAAFRLVDRMVRDAQHRSLMGAGEDEDDEE